MTEIDAASLFASFTDAEFHISHRSKNRRKYGPASKVEVKYHILLNVVAALVKKLSPSFFTILPKHSRLPHMINSSDFALISIRIPKSSKFSVFAEFSVVRVTMQVERVKRKYGLTLTLVLKPQLTQKGFAAITLFPNGSYSLLVSQDQYCNEHWEMSSHGDYGLRPERLDPMQGYPSEDKLIAGMANLYI